MKRAAIFLLLAGVLSAAEANAQSVLGRINDDGFIVLSGDVDLLGVHVTSANGNLIPIPGDVASPFNVLLRNTAEEVVLGSVGKSNAISLEDDLVLNIGYQTTGIFDLEGNWGGPLDGQQGDILFSSPTPTVPEPSTGLLGMASMAALLMARCRREHTR